MRIISYAATLLVLVANHSNGTEQTSPQQALARAVEYLWSQQQENGSWRSEQYAVLRSGQALTPFVLHTLLEVGRPLESEHASKSLRAVKFIVDHLDDEGALGKADPDILEYPVYSTAYAVLALNRLQAYHYLLSGEGDKQIKRMRKFLRDAQFTEECGFLVGLPAFGGWGFDKAQKLGETGHMDLAHTRRAIQAMGVVNQFLRREADFEERIAIPVQRFLAVVQKRPETLKMQPVPAGVERPAEIPFDGGFYFSPVVLQANKGRTEKEGNYWRSYSTATCDGILALLAAGVPQDDERVTAAVAWMREHTNLDYPQGIPTDYPEPWGAALKYYHFAVRAEVYRALDFPTEERAALAAAVMKHQREDGSFVNTASPLMKEDEPLLATTLAVVALTNCLP